MPITLVTNMSFVNVEPAIVVQFVEIAVNEVVAPVTVLFHRDDQRGTGEINRELLAT